MGADDATLRAAMKLADQLFDAPEATREALLAHAEPAVRDQARRLLLADAGPCRILAQPAGVAVPSALRLVQGAASRTGVVFDGRFEVERLVDVGGMGVIYRALDHASGNPVALKVLSSTDGEHAARFVREGRTLADLDHPNIVRHVAHGLTAEGELYLAMEWLEGENLAAMLARAALSMRESVMIVRCAAEALAFAHARGIVHRDLKPSNLFVVGSDAANVKLLDFGVARGQRTVSTLTGPGTILGTLGYMSPEQARGDAEIDARTDVFALGCILFECLTGERAFSADRELAVLAKILVDDPPPPSSLRPKVSPLLDRLVASMLHKQVERRPESAGVVARELLGLHLDANEGEVAQTPPRPEEALTAGEQRLVSIVVVKAKSSGRPGARPVGPEERAARGSLASVLAPHGARPHWTADGSILVTLTGVGVATDVASRAARCALALRDRLEHRPIVVVTGRSVLDRRLPVGDAIDRAEALSSRAGEPAGHETAIRVDELTQALLGDGFELRRERDGFSLLGERDATSVMRLLLGKPTPLVGREREMATLRAVFDECVRELAARALLVTGPAGIGKSRLRHEFLRELEARREEARVWFARADPMSAGSPLRLLADAVRRGVDLSPGEELASARKRLSDEVSRVVAPGDAKRVAEFLGELVGVPFPRSESVMLRAAHEDALLMGDQVRQAFEDFVAAQAKIRPVVVVLDDLQWGDRSTVAYLDGALRNLRDLPLMVLAFARPEAHEHFEHLWEQRARTEIRLAGLTRRASERLTHEALGGSVSEEVVKRVVERADGNAFYLEELIRSVAEGEPERLPETVLAMVEVRVATLDGESRRVLRAASVFGQTFSTAGVRALLGGDPRARDLETLLDRLAQREVITALPVRRGEGDRAFTFRHALLREGAYAMLTEEDKALGHRLAGRWLEQAGQLDAVVLAEHYERGGAPRDAIEAYRRASEQALSGNDYKAAIAHADRAIACGSTGSSLGALRALQAVAHRWGGRIEDAESCAALAAEASDVGSAVWFEAMAWNLWSSSRLGHVERVRPLVDELGAATPKRGAEGASVIALCRAACQLMSAGDYAPARDLHTLAEARAASCEIEPVQDAYLFRTRAFAAGILSGDNSESIEHSSSAAAAFERAGDLRGACQEQINVGNGYLQLGLYAEAKAVLLKAYATAERLALPPMMAFAAHNLGPVLARLGEVEDGRAFEERAMREFEALGDCSLTSASASYLARIALEARDFEGAAVALSRALSFAENHPAVRALALATAAYLKLTEGSAAEALLPATQAKAMLDELGTLEDGEQLIYFVHAEALFANGSEEEAMAALAEGHRSLVKAAERIKNEVHRRAFLRIPENARTLERLPAPD